MSLRGIHILFIFLSIATFLGFAGWCFAQEGATNYPIGAFSLALAVGLSVYWIYFIRKSAQITRMER